MAKKKPTRQLIVEAAITCIEKYGLEAATTRRIAVEAGTNIASINYHFRSKDHLLGEVLSMTVNHMLQDVFAAIDDKKLPFPAMLTDVLFYLLDGGLRYPGVSKAHLRRAIDDKSHQSISAKAMLRVFDGLSSRAARAYPNQDPKHIRLRTAQLMSCIMFTILRPDFFKVAPPYQLTNSKHAGTLARDYAQFFLESL